MKAFSADRHGVPFGGTREEYTMLEQAARNAMHRTGSARVHDLGGRDSRMKFVRGVFEN